MAVIGISLNEVLRDYIGQLIYTYEKYFEKLDINELDVKSLDLLKYFKFNSKNDLNNFLYSEASLEIFGHADLTNESVIVKLNNFLLETNDEESHQIMLVGKEVNKSIPATLFFLSKTGCRVNKINFVQDSINEWDGVDVLITANPDALMNKPIGKISVKVNAPYNSDSNADFEVNSLIEFINDDNLRNKILNVKTIAHE